MDNLEIYLESNLDKVDKQLDSLIGKFGTLSKAVESITNNKAFTNLGRDVQNAYKQMSKAPTNNGVKNSLEESRKSAEKLIAEITERVKDINPQINVDNKSVEQLEHMATTLKDKMANARTEIEAIAKSSSYDSQTKGLERYITKLTIAEKQLAIVNEAIQNKKAPSSYSGSSEIAIHTMEDVQKEVASLQQLEDEYTKFESVLSSQPLSQIEKSFEPLKANIKTMNDYYRQEEELVDKYETLQARYEKALGIVTPTSGSSLAEAKSLDAQQFVDTYNSVNKLTEALASVEPLDLPTDNVYEFNKAVTDLTLKLETLLKKEGQMNGLGVDTESQKYIKLQMEVEQIVQTLDKYKDKIDSVRQDGALELKIAPINESIMGQFESRTNSLKESLKNMRILVPTQDFERITKEIKKVEDEYNRLSQKMKQAIAVDPNYGTTDSFKKHMVELEALREEYRKLMLEKQNLDRSGGFEFNFSGLSALRNGLTRLSAMFSKVNSKIGQFIKKVTSAINPVKKLKSAMSSFDLANVGLVKSLTKTSNMLMLMIKRMALRDVIKNATDGFQNLVQFSDKTNASVSLLWNSFRQLGNAFASAIAPMLNAFAGALNNLIQLIIRVVDKVNQLISALTGSKTWIRAKKLTDNYAKSLDKADKKAKGTLQSFDALNNLTSQDDSKDGTPPEDMFEEVPIDKGTKDLADKFKKWWHDADFYDLGKAIGQWLKDALDNIPWGKIKAIARKLGRSLASLINGFVEVEGLGYSIGRTLAEALNTAFEFLDAYIRELHWDSIGHFIADTLNGFFESIDWDLIHRTFTDGAKGLAQMMNKFIEDFNWDNISTTISNAINTISDTIYTFFKRMDFGDLGSRIGEQITKTIEKIDWELLGRAIGIVIQKAVNFASGLIKKLDWDTFKNAFTDFIKGFKAELDPKVYKNITRLVKALIGLKAILVAITGIEGLAKFVKSMKDLNALKFISSQWKGFTDIFKNFSKGFGGKDTLATIFNIDNGVQSNIKTFLSSLKGGLDEVRSGLGGLQKAFITVGSVVIEFKTVKDFFYDLSSGAEMTAGKIGKLIAVLGGVGVALYTALGPIGLVIEGLTLVGGAIAGLQQHAEEVAQAGIGNAIYDALLYPKGTPIESIPQVYVDAFRPIRTELEKIINAGDNLDIIQGDLDLTAFELEKIDKGFSSGAISAEDAVERIKNALDDLTVNTQKKVAELQDALLIALGENGLYVSYFESLGVAIDTVQTSVITISEHATERLKEISKELSQLRATDPTNPKIQQLRDELMELSGATSHTVDATAELRRSIDYSLQHIDYSGLIDTDTMKVSSEQLSSICAQIGDVLQATSEDVDSYFTELQEQLEQEIKIGLINGDDVSELQKTLEVLPSVLEQAQGDVSAEGLKFAETVQKDLVDKVDDVINNAKEEYSNLNFFEKLFSRTSEDEYIYKALQEYKTNVIDPFEKGLQENFDGLKEEGALYLGEAVDGIMGDLKPINARSTRITQGELNERFGFKKAIQDSMEDAKTNSGAGECAEYITEEFTHTMEIYNSQVHDTGMTYGTLTMEGVQEGAESQEGATTSAVKTVVDNVSNNALNGMDTKFNETGIKAMLGLGKGMQSQGNSILSWARSFVDSLGQLFSGLISKISSGFKDIKSNFSGFQLGNIRIPKFANGGFPEDGLFFANHNELVGSFANGKSAVANNEQITQGIREASYQGMKQALAESSFGTNIRIEGDPNGMFKVIQDEANNYTKRTGYPAFI